MTSEPVPAVVRRTRARRTIRRGRLIAATIIALAGVGVVSGVNAASSDAAVNAPFSVRAGHPYDIVVKMSGVHRGDRLAVEMVVRRHWKIIGRYHLKAGQRHLRKTTNTAVVGTYKLRTSILRHGHRVHGSASHPFRVRVTGIPRPPIHFHRGQARLNNPRAGTERRSTVSWNSIECGAFAGQHGVLIHAPFSRPADTSQSGRDGSWWVYQVVWARDAYPGGSYGNWHVAATSEQFVQSLDSAVEDVTLAPWIAQPYYFAYPILDYTGDGAMWHQYAWDYMVYTSSGWVWYDADHWIQADGYRQTDGDHLLYSDSCYTL